MVQRVVKNSKRKVNSMSMKKMMVGISVMMLLCGCAGLYKSIVTVTEIRQSVMNTLGEEFRKGNIGPELDKKIQDADIMYLEAAAKCRAALVAFQAGEASERDKAEAFRDVKAALDLIIDLTFEILGPNKATKFSNQLNDASQL